MVVHLSVFLSKGVSILLSCSSRSFFLIRSLSLRFGTRQLCYLHSAKEVKVFPFSSFSQAYADMIAERRKRVSNGVEDTFGLGETR